MTIRRAKQNKDGSISFFDEFSNLVGTVFQGSLERLKAKKIDRLPVILYENGKRKLRGYVTTDKHGDFVFNDLPSNMIGFFTRIHFKRLLSGYIDNLSISLRRRKRGR